MARDCGATASRMPHTSLCAEASTEAGAVTAAALGVTEPISAIADEVVAVAHTVTAPVAAKADGVVAVAPKVAKAVVDGAETKADADTTADADACGDGGGFRTGGRGGVGTLLRPGGGGGGGTVSNRKVSLQEEATGSRSNTCRSSFSCTEKARRKVYSLEWQL